MSSFSFLSKCFISNQDIHIHHEIRIVFAHEYHLTFAVITSNPLLVSDVTPWLQTCQEDIRRSADQSPIMNFFKLLIKYAVR